MQTLLANELQIVFTTGALAITANLQGVDTTVIAGGINNKETAITNQQRELLDLIDQGKLGWDKVCELGQVLIGAHPGRKSEQQIIYYKSNTGVGIQFAAAGALIYEECKKQGLGRELPSEWFGADLSEWMDKGFMPSP
ncbi:MAG TPA: hypothetical protein VJ646_09850 [Candidatus Binatia bacterium]|nr:hypothetical protein [Candidatus Binatia bacterium]